MSVYAVGDVHGCADELEALLNKVDFSPSKDTLWLVGDLINRGPRSLEALRIAKRVDAKMVLGNHDLSFLSIAAGAHKPGKRDTVDDILQASDHDELLEWLRYRPLFLRHPDMPFCMAHAGLLPQWSYADAQRYSDDFSAVLRSDQWTDLMSNLFGNRPDYFDEKLSGWDRLRAIANVYTRMRFIDAEGHLDFTAKLGPDKAPKGYRPWFQYPRENDNLTILFGHWAALMGSTPKAAIRVEGLDTGCAWGGRLTLLDLKTQERISVPAIKSNRH
ncbi:Bis(5'-nucleosyl)-tetraphosphatase symmetrical [Halomonadaceae bacterium LMG 33818]|uniref:symmetrical bis(5'-nucleosyl)-tetraphosphatase n=1 Tax=Cernens ardua TaxID=3402176 RepID=UPI003EDCA4C3